MKYFYYKLIPPRPSFPSDITPQEQGLMQQHTAYWTAEMHHGTAIAFGPVLDPKGTYGVCLLRLDESADPHELANNDPVIKANAGFRYELHDMPRLMHVKY